MNDMAEDELRQMAEQFAIDFGIDRQKYSRIKVGKNNIAFRTDHNYNGSGGWSEGEPAISVPKWIIQGYNAYTTNKIIEELERVIELTKTRPYSDVLVNDIEDRIAHLKETEVKDE